MTENDRKNVEMNVWIVKSHGEMAKIHSYHETWLPSRKKIVYGFSFWPLSLDIDIGQRSENA